MGTAKGRIRCIERWEKKRGGKNDWKGKERRYSRKGES